MSDSVDANSDACPNSVGHCCVHIGLPKTATTWLQAQLFEQHSQVAFFGKFQKQTKQGQCRDDETYSLMKELAWDNVLSPDLALCRQIYEKSIAPEIERGKVPVFSWESLSSGRREIREARAANFRAVFENCRILIVLLHPLKLVESMYYQHFKWLNIEDASRFGVGPRYVEMETWLKTKLNSSYSALQARLDYAETVRIFCDTFGEESVGLFLFEDLKQQEDGLTGVIPEFLGIDPQEARSYADNDRENVRWSPELLTGLQQIHASFFQSLKFRFKTRGQRIKMLEERAQQVEHVTVAHAAVAEKWQYLVADMTREGNRWLKSTYGLPLDEFDYPL